MSHQHNVDMHRTRIKTLRSARHPEWLRNRIEEERARIADIERTIEQLQYELDYILELIEAEEKALRRSLKIMRHEEHKAQIEKLLKLQREIARTQEEIDAAESEEL